MTGLAVCRCAAGSSMIEMRRLPGNGIVTQRTLTIVMLFGPNFQVARLAISIYPLLSVIKISRLPAGSVMAQAAITNIMLQRQIRLVAFSTNHRIASGHKTILTHLRMAHLTGCFQVLTIQMKILTVIK